MNIRDAENYFKLYLIEQCRRRFVHIRIHIRTTGIQIPKGMVFSTPP